MTPDSVVTLERLPGHIARVTLNRPQARNAVDGNVAERLDALVAETEADADTWVVVLTGAGPDAFCAGADLKAIAAGHGRRLRTSRGGFAGFVDAPRVKPWIAAVNGAALAGGAEVALACDLVVAADHAVFGLPEVQRGLIAGAGGLYRLPRALPRHLALELIATGDPLYAARAHRHGLVNRLVLKEEVQATALELAARIARNAPLAVRESLAIARRAHDLGDDELRQLSAKGLAAVAATEDFKEGPRAFIEKRAPNWVGR